MAPVSIGTVKRIRGQKLAGLTRVRRRALVLIDTHGSKTQLSALMKELDDALEEVVRANAEYMNIVEDDEAEVAAALKYEESAEEESTKVQEKIHAHLKSREGEPASVTSQVSRKSRLSKASSAREAEIEARVLQLQETQLRARLEKEKEKEELQRQLLLQEKKDEVIAAQLKVELTKAAESELAWERKDDFKDEAQAQDRKQPHLEETRQEEKHEAIRTAVSRPPADKIKAVSPAAQTQLPSSAQNCCSSLFKHSLPKLRLPIFSGNIEEFPRWLAMFEALVKNQPMDDREKMVHLQAAITGSAKTMIGGMLFDGDSFSEALRVLKDRYGRSSDVVQATLKTVFSCPSPRYMDARSLEKYHGSVHTATTTLKHMGFEGDLHSTENLRRMVGKLPVELRKSWAEHSIQMELPTLLDFDVWLRTQVRILINCEATAPSSGQKKVAATFTATTTTSAKPQCCILCAANHDVRQCPDFRSKTVDERAQFAADNRCCFSCLKRGHVTRDCRIARTCGIDGCVLRHNRLIHGSKRIRQLNTSAPTAMADTDPKREACMNERTIASVTDAGSPTVLLQVVPVHVRGKNGRYKDTLALLDPGAQTSLCEEGLLEELELIGEPHTCIEQCGVGWKGANLSKGAVGVKSTGFDGGQGSDNRCP